MPLAETRLISSIRRQALKASRAPQARDTRTRLMVGIGDDCAVLRVPAGHEVLVTTDFSLEGVHFRREWHPPELIGHRCLTRGLSDIAAMGGVPAAAFLSLALPAHTPQAWVDAFVRGLLKLAKQFNVALAGGDTTQSEGRVLADIIVLGSVARGSAILRSGARPGDRIYVTGALGEAAAEIDFFYKRSKGSAKKSHVIPQPRIAIGQFLHQRRIATAMIDISDGLSTDLWHICENSGVGANLRAQAIPRGRFRGRKVEPDLALHGGDAYELLFTARKQTSVPGSIKGVPVTAIGEVVRTPKMMVIESDGRRRSLQPRGWEPFRNLSSSRPDP